jgi:hypothetical protein
MANEPGAIRSVQELREHVPAILKQLNADPALLQAAASNPIFALEELGYEIPRELRRALEHRIRFTPVERRQLDELTSQINQLAGDSMDPEDPVALEQLLFKRLKLPALPPEPVRISVAPTEPTTRRWPAKVSSTRADAHREESRHLTLHPLSLVYQPPGTTRQPDVLAPLIGAHPIIQLLIRYREIATKHPPFAPRELYDRVRRGDMRGPAFKLRARFHRDRTE